MGITLLLAIGIGLLPILALAILAYGCYKFDKEIKNNQYIQKVDIELTFKDLMPWRLESCLKSNKETDLDDISSFLKSYKLIITIVLGYGIFWIVYIGYTILQIYFICSGKYANAEPTFQGAIIVSVVINILCAYWLFLMPIFERLGMTRAVEIGFQIFSAMCSFVDFITEKYIKLVRLFCPVAGLLPLLFLLYGYIVSVKWCMYSLLSIEISMWSMLFVLIMYQYLILDFLSKILFCLISKIKWFQQKHGDFSKDIIKGFLCNYTYLVMVIIYAFAIGRGNEGNEIPIALAILFLIDTFIKNNKEIQEKLKKQQKMA